MPTAKKRAPYDLNQSPLFRIRTKRRLAVLLQLEQPQLLALSKSSGRYNEWDRKSESGKTRHIESPRDGLAQVQRRIADVLSRVAVPNFVYCPTKGKSYVMNARQHVNGIEVRCLDIAAYFDSTASWRVFFFFHKIMQCSRDVSGILTSLVTYKGHLPTGSPSSPVMSFYAHMDMWLSIGELAAAAGCTITVYMDDITISGVTVTDKLLWEIKRKIHQNGLRYHKEKRFSGGRAREVTGIIIANGKLKLPNRQHKKIHDLRQNISIEEGVEKKESLNIKLQGHIAQARQIERENMTGIA